MPLIASLSSCPDLDMPGFAQRRGDLLQVNAKLPALERAEELTCLVGPCPGLWFLTASGTVSPSCRAVLAPFLQWQRCGNADCSAHSSAPFPLLPEKTVPVLRAVEMSQDFCSLSHTPGFRWDFQGLPVGPACRRLVEMPLGSHKAHFSRPSSVLGITQNLCCLRIYVFWLGNLQWVLLA